MIIANGTIETKHKEAHGIDPDTGYPTAPTVARWSEPVPCQYSAISYNNLGRANGEHFTAAQYSILIEQQPLHSEQIRLRDRRGSIVGEFSIKQAEPLDAVCQICITV